MRLPLLALSLVPPFAALAQAPVAGSNAVARPAALVADAIPPIPLELADRSRPYMEFRTASFAGWNASDSSMLITTRFGNTNQIHRVARPMGTREQLSFEVERVSGQWSPTGDVLLATKDVGGNEFYEIYTLRDGRLTLITDGRSRNTFGAWSRDGRLIGYSSTRRNGRDTDLYVVDPRDRATDRMVAQVSGGGWGIGSFAPDGRSAVVREYVQITKSNLHLLDVASGRLTPIGDHSLPIAYGGAEFAPDGTLWVTSDEGSEFKRLGTLDLQTGSFTAVESEPRWDVTSFAIAQDGSFIAYAVNEAGSSRVRILDPRTRQVRNVDALPAGIVSGLRIAPWGEIGLTFTSARNAADAYSVDPRTLRVTRWTRSETGGLDVNANVEPERLEIRSFDGEAMSGFLYLPDPTRFTGRRPLIVSIHGGPESQARPGFLGRNNYLLNELGIAMFYPNVRGSSGYGKRFVGLDDGAFRREDSVRDIGAFLDALARHPALDSTRFGVTGGSYGGYMCYASAIHFGDRLRGANCVVAISNFATFLENTEDYRRDLRRVEYGDERDPQQRAKLLDISPLTRVSELRLPLMVVTGANDPRVPASEAEQIIAAVRGHGREAWHLLANDEGHGFARKVNQDYQFWTTLMFWERTLLADGRQK
jgi:dipeptidyl aminopeptidase/acylaminoacyl peptidase